MVHPFLSRTGRALRSQSIALVALCLAVSGGTAYAVAARNSVVSSSIKDGNVRNADLARDAVTSAKVANGKLRGVDLAPGTVTADQVDESGLGPVPLATQAGLGRISTVSTCNPEGATPASCATVVVPMPSAGRLLVTGSLAFRNDGGSGPADGVCLVAVDGTTAGETEMLLQSGDTAGRPTIAPVLHLTSRLDPGNHTVALRCTESTATGTLQVATVRVTAVALGGLVNGLDRLGRLVRSQALAVLALCAAVSGGTAYAVAGAGTVVSSSIKDGQVRTADLAPGGITHAQVEDGELTGADLAPDTLGDVQVDESGLSELALAVQGGRGRVSGTGTCDPESTTMVRCATVTISLVRTGRVLVLGSMTHRPDPSGNGVTRALCRVAVDGVSTSTSELEIFRADGAGRRSLTPVTWLTPQLLAGDHTVAVVCGESGSGTLTVDRARVAVVALSGL